MDFFLLQLQYNVKIIINNIGEKYNLSKKILLNEFYPKNLDLDLKKYMINNNNLIISQQINTKYFKDKNGNNYIIVDSSPIIAYGSEYTAIKV